MPVLSLAGAVEFVGERRKARKKIVFTNGVFDLLHIGHTRYLKRARQLGDVLIVGVNSDASVRTLGKGDDRPLTAQHDRAELLASLSFVDAVVIFDEPTPEPLIARLLPDILVKGSDWKDRENPGQKLIESRGGSMEFIPIEAGYSTTSILEKIKKSRL